MVDKFEKNAVAVDCVVKVDGMRKIRRLINEKTPSDFYMCYEDLLKAAGGRERVNAKGKMTKRIKRNLRRDHNIALTDSVIQEIGNIMDEYSLSAREYIVEYSTDFDGTVGNFGDSDSCFQSGGEFHDCLLAMEEHAGDYRDCFMAIRVYKANGDRLARAWVYNALDGATVLFNGYGLYLDKIAMLAAKLDGDQEQRRIKLDGDIYINDRWCVAFGGDPDRIDYQFRINPAYEPW